MRRPETAAPGGDGGRGRAGARFVRSPLGAAALAAGVALLPGATGCRNDEADGLFGTAALGGASSQMGGSPSTGGDAGTPDRVTCDPGDTRECVGPGACRGGQICAGNGTWEECDCGAATGGAPGAGGATGGATQSGGNVGTGGEAIGGGSATGGASDGGAATGGETGAGGGEPAGGTPAGGGTSGAGTSGGAAGAPAGGASPGGATGGGGDGLAGCESAEDTVTLAVTYRDFNAAHSDFEPSASGRDAATEGLVASMLGDRGAPVLVGADDTIASAQSFAEWYTDDPRVNATILGRLVLYRNQSGEYVNRWGADGERWRAYEQVTWCGEIGSRCSSCDAIPAGSTCYDPCPLSGYNGACSAELVFYDGTPVFFPIDEAPGALTSEEEYSTATIAPAYGGSWEVEPGEPRHNFHFTSELRFDFVYAAGQRYSVEVTGDDDVWVFVNRHLAIDLGGIHTPVAGAVEITNATAAGLGLVDGEVAEIAIFHAERQTTGSTLRLRFSGFDWATADCGPAEGRLPQGAGGSGGAGGQGGGAGEPAAGGELVGASGSAGAG